MKIHEYDLTRSDFCTLANLALGARFLFLGFWIPNVGGSRSTGAVCHNLPLLNILKTSLLGSGLNMDLDKIYEDSANLTHSQWLLIGIHSDFLFEWTYIEQYKTQPVHEIKLTWITYRDLGMLVLRLDADLKAPFSSCTLRTSEHGFIWSLKAGWLVMTAAWCWLIGSNQKVSLDFIRHMSLVHLHGLLWW